MSVTIVDYDPHWPVTFCQVRGALMAALGDVVIAVEHVGSTAVPGLAAKPVLDIDVVVDSLDRLPSVVQRMASIGYEHQGDLGITGRHAFKTPMGGHARHVYVCAVDAIPLREHLAFRDHLRQNSDDASAYAALKRELSKAVGDDRTAYTDRKTAFVQAVLSRCRNRPGSPAAE